MQTREYDTASLLRRLLTNVEREQGNKIVRGNVSLVRRKTENHAVTDSHTQSTQAAGGWDWSADSRWGGDSW